MPLLLLLLLLPVIVIVLTPIILVQRYRVGSSRRLARPWVATVNAAVMTFSALFFLLASGVTTFWVPDALRFAAAGLAIGCASGVVGLVLTRWEPALRTLHYTPNRWLILAVTFLVAGRMAYGLWRSWSVASAGFSATSFVNTFGIRETLAAGGIVIGYYLAYGVGLRWRIRRWQRRPLRPL